MAELKVRWRTRNTCSSGTWSSWSAYYDVSSTNYSSYPSPHEEEQQFISGSDPLTGTYRVLKNDELIFEIQPGSLPSSYVACWSSGDKMTVSYTPGVVVSDCSDNADCGSCEKCVDGECVPCDKCVDGKGIVTLWGVKFSDGSILTDGLPVDLSSGIASVQLSNFDPSMLTAGRIQIFNGMSGTLTIKAGIGVLGSDFGATVTLFSGAVSGHYQDFLFDSGNLSFGYSFNGKVVFEILNYDTIGDCADDDVDDTPDDAPIDVVEGGEPQPPGGSGPGTTTPPGGSNTIIKVIVIKPTPPDPGSCECEKYLADALYYNFDSLGNRLIDLTNSFDFRLSEQNSLIHSLLSDHNRILFEQFSESNRLSYELSLFLAKKFYPQLLKISSSIEALSFDVSAIKESTQSMSDDLSDIRDSLRLKPCEPDYPDGKTIVDIADDFQKHYYPAVVEVLENDVVLDTGSDDPDIFCRKLRK